jgi:hypothetical protein
MAAVKKNALLQLVPTMTHYAIEVTIPNFRKITKRDDRLKQGELALSERLDAVEGLQRTDYNGHFGPFVYVQIEKEFDTPELHAKLIDMIRSYYKNVKL